MQKYEIIIVLIASSLQYSKHTADNSLNAKMRSPNLKKSESRCLQDVENISRHKPLLQCIGYKMKQMRSCPTGLHPNM